MHTVITYLNIAIVIYTLLISCCFVLFVILAANALKFYIRKNSFVDYKAILSSPLAPSVSLIAPAFNEEKTIIDNIRSLMSIHYNNFEIIIVNDGSSDATMQKMIEAYALEKVDFAFFEKIPCKKVKGIYKSANAAFKNLLVVDKENGGKADALNAGINASRHNIITCIDVDCIIEQDALLKMVKPFIEESKPVIATGGVVRIANSCSIEDGRLTQARVSASWIPRFQVVEYLRAFLIGRMAWSNMNDLLLISGALGAFDKSVVIACGGYNTHTVGEDMELVVRMRRYMEKNKRPYKVVYIPDPLCWTEAPATYKTLSRQRNRWMRGTVETLLFHRKVFFNPRFGSLGLLSFPFWVFFEWLAPLTEFGGFIYFIFLILAGYVNWSTFIILFFTVYLFSTCITFIGILFEEYTYHQYDKKTDVIKLLLTALVEPFFFHPQVVWWGVRGNIDKLRGKTKWGEMTRAGFGKNK